jgi:hypothetical protein
METPSLQQVDDEFAGEHAEDNGTGHEQKQRATEQHEGTAASCPGGRGLLQVLL